MWWSLSSQARSLPTTFPCSTPSRQNEPGLLTVPSSASPAVVHWTKPPASCWHKLLEKHGVSARVQPFADVVSARSCKIDALDAPLVCLSYFGAVGSPAHVRYLIRRFRRLMPNARFLAGFWMLAEQPNKAEEWRTAVGAQLVATSLAQALAICVAEAQGDGALA
jgi:hypothetical protein